MRILGIIIVAVILVSCAEEVDVPDVVDTKIEEGYSNITCPSCGHTEKEKLPTETCQVYYNCKKCDKKLTPEGDDCCVYCTYGTHKCPSKQD